MIDHVVIVGGGLGAVRTAQALRDRDFDGGITVLSEEDVAPYDRPPLSKAFIAGTADEADVALLDDSERARLSLDLRLGARAVGLAVGRRRVRLADGAEVGYEALVVATGARPNRLRLVEGRDDVLYLRDLADARRLRAALASPGRIGIVGGGFIGLEIAAVAQTLGSDVVVVEAAEAPLAPVLGAELGGWIQEWHEEHGVRFLCGTPLARVQDAARGARLVLADGRSAEVDLVVVGVGVAPDVAWLREAGVLTHFGLVVDEDGRTSDPCVFGVGDVTCRHDAGACRRSGHWTATNEHARAVARAIVGGDAPLGPVQEGYFWSDQHDRRLQFAGRVGAAPRLRLLHGAVEDRAFVVALEDGDDVTGVFGLGLPREFIKASLALRRRQLAPAADGG